MIKRIAAQTRIEIALTLRRGESLLVTIAIPVGILVFFSLVDVLPHDGRAVDFLVPGVLALSVISSAMTNLSIAAGFERHAGVLRRLGTTPLGRGGLLAAKVAALVVFLIVQLTVVIAAALALGWRGAFVPAVAPILLVGTAAFAGLGFLMAGRLRAETNLALANGLFLVFLLLGGIVVPLTSLPDRLSAFARLLPAEPLASTLRSLLSDGAIGDLGSLVTLGAWAFVSCVLAARSFRWD